MSVAGTVLPAKGKYLSAAGKVLLATGSDLSAAGTAYQQQQYICQLQEYFCCQKGQIGQLEESSVSSRKGLVSCRDSSTKYRDRGPQNSCENKDRLSAGGTVLPATGTDSSAAGTVLLDMGQFPPPQRFTRISNFSINPNQDSYINVGSRAAQVACDILATDRRVRRIPTIVGLWGNWTGRGQVWCGW